MTQHCKISELQLPEKMPKFQEKKKGARSRVALDSSAAQFQKLENFKIQRASISGLELDYPLILIHVQWTFEHNCTFYLLIISLYLFSIFGCTGSLCYFAWAFSSFLGVNYSSSQCVVHLTAMGAKLSSGGASKVAARRLGADSGVAAQGVQLRHWHAGSSWTRDEPTAARWILPLATKEVQLNFYNVS